MSSIEVFKADFNINVKDCSFFKKLKGAVSRDLKTLNLIPIYDLKKVRAPPMLGTLSDICAKKSTKTAPQHLAECLPIRPIAC